LTYSPKDLRGKVTCAYFLGGDGWSKGLQLPRLEFGRAVKTSKKYL